MKKEMNIFVKFLFFCLIGVVLPFEIAKSQQFEKGSGSAQTENPPTYQAISVSGGYYQDWFILNYADLGSIIIADKGYEVQVDYTWPTNFVLGFMYRKSTSAEETYNIDEEFLDFRLLDEQYEFEDELDIQSYSVIMGYRDRKEDYGFFFDFMGRTSLHQFDFSENPSSPKIFDADPNHLLVSVSFLPSIGFSSKLFEGAKLDVSLGGNFGYVYSSQDFPVGFRDSDGTREEFIDFQEIGGEYFTLIVGWRAGVAFSYSF